MTYTLPLDTYAFTTSQNITTARCRYASFSNFTSQNPLLKISSTLSKITTENFPEFPYDVMAEVCGLPYVDRFKILSPTELNRPCGTRNCKFYQILNFVGFYTNLPHRSGPKLACKSESMVYPSASNFTLIIRPWGAKKLTVFSNWTFCGGAIWRHADKVDSECTTINLPQTFNSPWGRSQTIYGIPRSSYDKVSLLDD